jgi:hypothetical protein
MPWTPETIVVATDDQVSTTVGADVVILGMKEAVYYGLDAVGARVWELLRAPRSIRDIVLTLLDEFDVEEELCRTDVIALLEDLAARGLVREAPVV